MFVSLISVIITILISSITVSILSLKTNYIKSSTPAVEKFIFQEKILKEAVDSRCRIQFNSCKNAYNTEEVQAIGSLVGYYPLNTNITFAGEILLQRDIIKFVQDIPNKTEYVNYYMNKNNNLSCEGGEALPCTGRIVKTFNTSQELKILFIDYEVSLLEADKAAATTQAEIDAIQAEIDTLNAEKVVLLDEISLRKITGFGG